MNSSSSAGSAATAPSPERRTQLHGIIPYLVTPVDQASGRLSLRVEVLTELCEYLIGTGIHGLSPLGSTGEFAYLPQQLQVQVVRTVVAASGGRVPVVPCVGAFATASAIEQAQAFEAAGADALVVILQEYFPISVQQTVRFFQTVADSVTVPICIYTNPGTLGSALPLEAIQEISKHPMIQYIKDASTNTGRILSILNACDGRIQVFSASAHVPALVFALGGVGWMAGPAAIAPRECLRLYELAKANDWSATMRLQRNLWQLNEAFAKYSLAASMKAALTLQGFDVGLPVAPQVGLSGDAIAHIQRILEAVVTTSDYPAKDK